MLGGCTRSQIPGGSAQVSAPRQVLMMERVKPLARLQPPDPATPSRTTRGLQGPSTATAPEYRPRLPCFAAPSAPGMRAHPEGATPLDRKSTRLNSSHL